MFMKAILFLLCTQIPMVALSQDIANAQKKKERLLISIAIQQDSVILLDQLITKLKIESVSKNNDYRLAVLNQEAIVKDDYEGKIIGHVNKGDTVKIYAWKWWDLLVEYKIGKLGYIGEGSIIKDGDLLDFIALLTEKARQDRMTEIDNESVSVEKVQKEARIKRESTIKSKFSKYGAKIVSKIIENKIWIGMTSEMAVASWGSPDQINKSVSTYGTKEQWVYSGDYLYFELGLLKSYQTSR